MRFFPFVSREHHSAVLLERDRVIVALKETISILERRLLQPVPVTVQLPKDFAVIQPAVVQQPRVKKKRGEVIAPSGERIDLADVDENNLQLLGVLAIQKYGRRAHNSYEGSQWIRGMQTEIRAAKSAKRRREAKEKTAPPPEVAQLQEGIELDEDVDESKVPCEVLERIHQAERGE